MEEALYQNFVWIRDYKETCDYVARHIKQVKKHKLAEDSERWWSSFHF